MPERAWIPPRNSYTPCAFSEGDLPMTKVTRAMFDQYMTPNYAPAPMILDRGRGSRVWDQEGIEYIDFAGGIAVNTLGHAAPELVEVLVAQAQKLWHVSNAYATAPSIALAKALTEATFADRVFFANSGGEANEAALKLARRYASDRHGSEKAHIVSFDSSFQGRTLFTVAVGGQPKYREGFGPTPGLITHLPYNDLDAAGEAMSDAVCAVIVEPVQGEGGLMAGDPAFLHRLRALCDAHDALLIFDEVQSGMGRTGDLFAYMGYGVTPDILTSAKALGGGIPIGAMLTTEEVAASFVVGTHGSTFGGNPLATAVAGRVLEIISQPEFLAEVRRKAGVLFEGLEAVNRELEAFDEVRGKGLWAGCALSEPFRGRSAEFAAAALAAGVLVLRAGPDVVRFAPALNIPDEDIVEGIERFRVGIAPLLNS